MNIKVILVIVIIVVIAALLAGSLFTVDETEQAIVIQLGRFVREVKQPGLHFKIPLIQTEHKFEARVLEYDAAAKTIITGDKNTLILITMPGGKSLTHLNSIKPPKTWRTPSRYWMTLSFQKCVKSWPATR